MNSQLYTAASGLLAEERKLELISNNLANLSTPGYRAERSFSAVYQRFGDGADASVRVANAAVALAGTYEAPGTGPIRETGRELDVALSKNRLLVVQTSVGRRYTRAGSLDVSPAGELTDAQGNPILGPSFKPITGLVPGAFVTADGSVVANGAELGKVLVVEDPERVLRREGSNLLTAEGDDDALRPVTDPELSPGWIEGSGADALRELVDMIEAQRAFESYQKVISLTMNDVNRKAVSDIAG
jgi:flagellar basal body rod protein FlgG